MAVAHFRYIRFFLLLYTIPVLFLIFGYINYRLNFFSLDHIFKYKAVIIPKFLEMPILITFIIILIFWTLIAVRAKGVYLRIVNCNSVILEIRVIMLINIEIDKAKISGPLNSVITIPVKGGRDIRLPTMILRERQAQLMAMLNKAVEEATGRG